MKVHVLERGEEGDWNYMDWEIVGVFESELSAQLAANDRAGALMEWERRGTEQLLRADHNQVAWLITEHEVKP